MAARSALMAVRMADFWARLRASWVIRWRFFFCEDLMLAKAETPFEGAQFAVRPRPCQAGKALSRLQLEASPGLVVLLRLFAALGLLGRLGLLRGRGRHIRLVVHLGGGGSLGH